MMQAADGMGREQHLPIHQPRACVHDQITHRQVPVVKIKILHMADVAIRRAEFVSE